MQNNDLAFTPAWRQKELLESRQLSPVELTEMYLGRIEALDGQLNSFITVLESESKAAARKADAADPIRITVLSRLDAVDQPILPKVDLPPTARLVLGVGDVSGVLPSSVVKVTCMLVMYTISGSSAKM